MLVSSVFLYPLVLEIWYWKETFVAGILRWWKMKNQCKRAGSVLFGSAGSATGVTSLTPTALIFSHLTHSNSNSWTCLGCSDVPQKRSPLVLMGRLGEENSCKLMVGQYVYRPSYSRRACEMLFEYANCTFPTWVDGVAGYRICLKVLCSSQG